jgi:hypothetical protein
LKNLAHQEFVLIIDRFVQFLVVCFLHRQSVFMLFLPIKRSDRSKYCAKG